MLDLSFPGRHWSQHSSHGDESRLPCRPPGRDAQDLSALMGQQQFLGRFVMWRMQCSLLTCNFGCFEVRSGLPQIALQSGHDSSVVATNFDFKGADVCAMGDLWGRGVFQSSARVHALWSVRLYVTYINNAIAPSL